MTRFCEHYPWIMSLWSFKVNPLMFDVATGRCQLTDFWLFFLEYIGFISIIQSTQNKRIFLDYRLNDSMIYRFISRWLAIFNDWNGTPGCCYHGWLEFYIYTFISYNNIFMRGIFLFSLAQINKIMLISRKIKHYIFQRF